MGITQQLPPNVKTRPPTAPPERAKVTCRVGVAFLGHLDSCGCEVLEGVPTLVLGVLNHTWRTSVLCPPPEPRELTNVGVARKLGGPAHKGRVLELARGDGPAADRVDDARVRELGLGVDNAVGDVVVQSLGGCQIRERFTRVGGQSLRCARPA